MRKRTYRACLALIVSLGGGIVFTSSSLATGGWSEPIPVDLVSTGSAVSCTSAAFCVSVDREGRVSSYDGTTWAQPIGVDTASSLTAVSCPTTSFCVAVDSNGNALKSTNPTGDASAWPRTSVDSVGLTGVSCASASFCVAVDSSGNAFTYDGSHWTSSGQIDASVGITGVSCTSPSFCVAVDNQGNALHYNGSSWAIHNIDTNGGGLTAVSCTTNPTLLCVAVDNGSGLNHSSALKSTDGDSWPSPAPVGDNHPLTAVSCSSTTFCDATDNTGAVFHYNSVFSGGTYWHATASSVASSTGVSCPTISFCVVLDNTGAALRYSGGSWSATLGSKGRGISATSCPSVSFCVAVDNGGNILISVDNWVTSRTRGVDANAVMNNGFPVIPSLTSVSCPTVSFCAAVDNSGQVLTYNGSTWSAPTIVGTVAGSSPVTLVPLTSVSCASPSFCVAVDGDQTDPTSNIITYNGSTWNSSRTTVDVTENSTTTVTVASGGFPNIPTVTSGSPLVTVTGANIPANTTIWAYTAGANTMTLSLTATTSDTDTLTFATFNDQTIGLVGVPLTGVSCALATSSCQVVDSVGNVFSYNGSTFPKSTNLNNQDLTSISCSSATDCVAVDNLGAYYTYSGGAWVTSATADTNPITSVSCPNVSFCLDVDNNGSSARTTDPVLGLPWTPLTWVDNDLTQNPITHRWLTSISCTPDASQCAAVDMNGYAIIYSNAPRPSAFTLPTISGITQNGQVLTGAHGGWHNSPTSYFHQWRRCDSGGANCADIAGATSGTYALTSDDIGSTIRVQETAENSSGDSSPINSASTGVIQALPLYPPVNTSAPSISGATTGVTLTASSGTWTGTQPISYAYQWQSCDMSGSCNDVGNANGQTYSPTSDDIGKNIQVVVTATSNDGSSQATSNQLGPIVLGLPVNTVRPNISGVPDVGGVLAAGVGTWTGTQPINYTYQWQDCGIGGICNDISGANGQTYSPTAGNLGDNIQVVVTASNGEGAVQATSNQLGPIVPTPLPPCPASKARLQALLLKAALPTGKNAKIKAILKHSTYATTLAAPCAGTFKLSWYQVPKGAHVSAKKPQPLLVASVSAGISGARTVHPAVRLNSKGKALLKQTKRSVSLTVKATFAPMVGNAVSVVKVFTLRS